MGSGGGEAGDEQAPEVGSYPLPQLGLGRARTMRTLLDVVPLEQLKRSISSHVSQLPRSPLQSPLAPFVQQSVQVAKAVLLCGLESNLAMIEVSVSLLKLICFLLEKGLGAKPEEGDGGEDGEGEGKTEWASGTGMGEGDGVKDVTDEITDDAQLEGTRNEDQTGDKEQPDVPKPSEDTAREVGFDLDTEAQAVPQDEEAAGDDKNEKEKEEEADMDRQQGDVDLNAGGTLDEKMWNGDDDDKGEEEEKNKGKQQEEEIEAHGAEGEGEADQTAQDEKDKKGKERASEKD